MGSAGTMVYAVYSDKDCAQWTGNLEDVTTKSDLAAGNPCCLHRLAKEHNHVTTTIQLIE